jgi:hypothetical protein
MQLFYNNNDHGSEHHDDIKSHKKTDDEAVSVVHVMLLFQLFGILS